MQKPLLHAELNPNHWPATPKPSLAQDELMEEKR